LVHFDKVKASVGFDLVFFCGKVKNVIEGAVAKNYSYNKVNTQDEREVGKPSRNIHSPQTHAQQKIHKYKSDDPVCNAYIFFHLKNFCPKYSSDKISGMTFLITDTDIHQIA
jgi:hypothetical protein